MRSLFAILTCAAFVSSAGCIPNNPRLRHGAMIGEATVATLGLAAAAGVGQHGCSGDFGNVWSCESDHTAVSTLGSAVLLAALIALLVTTASAAPESSPATPARALPPPGVLPTTFTGPPGSWPAPARTLTLRPR
jgi:L-cystine uptake protein TcyP (sodium:dicarboxylate symporter family)